MSNKICVCTYDESQNTTNILTMIYSVLQMVLFSYPIINLHDSPQNKTVKVILGIFCCIALTLFIFSLVNIIRGAEENIKLRKHYCKGVQLQRKSDKECKFIYNQQTILNFLNLFNCSICAVFCGLILFYYLGDKKIMIGSIVCIILCFFTFTTAFITVKNKI